MSRSATPVRRILTVTVAALTAFLSLAGTPAKPTGQAMDPARAREIIDRMDRLLRGDSSHGKMEMRVVTKRWKRAIGMEIWSVLVCITVVCKQVI